MSRSRMIALLFLSALSQAAWAQTGSIVTVEGHVTVQRQGTTVPAPEGFGLQPGDVVTTGSRSKAQIVLADDSVFAMPSGGALRIDALERRKPDTRDPGQAILTMLRGGFRTITGLIGKSKGDVYEVRTSMATIGVRGTEYSALLCEASCTQSGAFPAGLYVKAERGLVMMSNRSGKLQLRKGQVGYAVSQDRSPVLVTHSPFDVPGIYSDFKITVDFDLLIDPPRIEPEAPASPS